MNILRLINNQREYFNSGQSRDVKFRIEQLKRLKVIFEKYEDECILALGKDLGKSQTEAYLTEVVLIRDELKMAIRNTKKWSKPKRVPTPIILAVASSYRQPEPYGVTLIVSPWNYPIALGLMPLIGAISAGNTAVLKPSELAPASSVIITKIISECFRPEHVISIEGGVEVATELLQHRYDYIFFTGGTKVGQVYYEAAAKNLTPVTLELGGKSPCVVDKKVNINETAKRIVFGKYLNCGQSCTAPDYILVHASVKNDLINALKKNVIEMYGENPEDNDEYPRIISDGHFDRICSLIDEKHIAFGGNSNKGKKYISPTFIALDSTDNSIMNEEIFGPVLPILSFKNIDEVKTLIKSKERPLALYIFTKNKKVENDLLHNISFGGACVNDTMTQYANPNLPFGGVGHSGIGDYHGEYSFKSFSHYKSIFKKSMTIDFTRFVRYAPWKGKFNFIKKIV
ncbi:MAG: aldehyde dehydrogenase [Candidatus Marinimicrobia bacterium]|jgi:aldehyde dehydrogenase (NAD+)|nr:aldehyde dehydrogenase [Candidatus Neomarinimicrobiota bacterium]MBT5956720.1 aldehyde dehydrogenase [Candidatus Neomarinimicrobiota bacterium]MBT7378223.1 aldehyde dehydrogenase [Candidatus Neomarinimicrobiota bacterium]